MRHSVTYNKVEYIVYSYTVRVEYTRWPSLLNTEDIEYRRYWIQKTFGMEYWYYRQYTVCIEYIYCIFLHRYTMRIKYTWHPLLNTSDIWYAILILQKIHRVYWIYSVLYIHCIECTRYFLYWIHETFMYSIQLKISYILTPCVLDTHSDSLYGAHTHTHTHTHTHKRTHQTFGMQYDYYRQYTVYIEYTRWYSVTYNTVEYIIYIYTVRIEYTRWHSLLNT